MGIGIIYLLIVFLMVTTGILWYRVGYIKGSEDVQDNIKYEISRLEETARQEKDLQDLMLRSSRR